MLKIIILVISLLGHMVYGQTIITDRPDQTESSSTITKGNLQIESGILVGFTGEESIRQLLAPTTLFRFGLTKGIEIRVLNQYESIKNKVTSTEVNGISDLEIGTKIQLFKKEGTNTEIAFLSHLVIPKGSEGLSSDMLGTINKLSISHQIGEYTGVGYNVGYDYFGTGSGNLTYSLAFGIGITDKVGVYLEPYGAIVYFENHEANFDAGMTYLLKDNLQLDFSFGTGLNHTMNYISTGVSWEISR